MSTKYGWDPILWKVQTWSIRSCRFVVLDQKRGYEFWPTQLEFWQQPNTSSVTFFFVSFVVPDGKCPWLAGGLLLSQGWSLRLWRQYKGGNKHRVNRAVRYFYPIYVAEPQWLPQNIKKMLDKSRVCLFWISVAHLSILCFKVKDEHGDTST